MYVDTAGIPRAAGRRVHEECCEKRGRQSWSYVTDHVGRHGNTSHLAIKRLSLLDQGADNPKAH
jgi:hypothetical protein